MVSINKVNIAVICSNVIFPCAFNHAIIWNFEVNIAAADGKATFGATAYAGTVITKVGFRLYTGPAFERLIHLNYRATRFNASSLMPSIMRTH